MRKYRSATRPAGYRGRRVLELGAGIGLPGMVAASFGARVAQTDRQSLAMSACRRNGERNGLVGVEYRPADWAGWGDEGEFDWILGSDILYGDSMHPHLRRILGSALAPGGRVLLADPFRAASLRLLEALETEGWGPTLSMWHVGEGGVPRPAGVFELTPPEGRATAQAAARCPAIIGLATGSYRFDTLAFRKGKA